MNIKKGIVIISAILILGFTLNFVVATTSNDLNVSVSEFPVLINGHQAQFEQDVVIINGNTYVPLRETANILGFNTVWNEERRRVEIRIPAEEFDFGNLGNSPDRPIRTSMTSLIANSERYTGRYILVRGIANIGFEENHLFLSRDDWEYRNFESGVGLSFGISQFNEDFTGFNPEFEALELLDGEFITVVGRFIALQHPLDPIGFITNIDFYGRRLNRNERAELNQN